MSTSAIAEMERRIDRAAGIDRTPTTEVTRVHARLPSSRSLLLAAIAATQLPAPATATTQPPVLEFGDAYTCNQPKMPVSALRNGATGDSKVTFVVAPDGSISNVAVSGTAGETPDHKRLDLAAIEHVRSCRYTGPGPKPTPGTYSVVVTWGFA